MTKTKNPKILSRVSGNFTAPLNDPVEKSAFFTL
jgi:hypothetical protein